MFGLNISARRLFAATLAAAALSALQTVRSEHADAATAIGSLPISVTVSDSCAISSIVGVAFTGFTAGTNSDASGSFNVTCTNGAAVSSITLDNGQNSVASQRYMKDASTHTLSYNLYSDSGRSTAWNTTTYPASSTYTANGNATSFTVYGRIPSTDNPIAATYNDSVTITVNYT